MRAYSASNEEALRARELVEDWRSEGFISAEQYQRMEPETACELRRTNIFLRVVLFLFTLIVAGTGVGLFFVAGFSHASEQTIGFFLLIFAGVSYAAAEFVVVNYKLYRHGIEEALAAWSVGFLCVGMEMMFSSGVFSPARSSAGFLIPTAGAVFSLWIWHRFGLPYAVLAAMIFVVRLPHHWTSSPAAQHLMIGAIYSAGVATVAALRLRHRFTYLHNNYSDAEALLWLGIYLTINLQLSAPKLFATWWIGFPASAEFPKPFYWTTWVLIWCLPPAVLARGLRTRDRWVIAAGMIAAVLTLVTNKPYLGWQRHTWDPILLGALLTGVALGIQRWLGKGPRGIRHGFTAQRMSAKDKSWMNLGITAVGLATPDIVRPSAQTGSPEPRFGGGDSGGGGASSDF